jgi:hypothetical protein
MHACATASLSQQALLSKTQPTPCAGHDGNKQPAAAGGAALEHSTINAVTDQGKTYAAAHMPHRKALTPPLTGVTPGASTNSLLTATWYDDRTLPRVCP